MNESQRVESISIHSSAQPAVTPICENDEGESRKYAKKKIEI